MGSMDMGLGTLLIATWLASGLLFLELRYLAQYYQRHSSKDPLYFKIIIAAIIVIDFVGLTAKYAEAYLYAVTHWGDGQYLLRQYWPLPLYSASEMLVSITVKVYLTIRYFHLTRNRVVALVLLGFILFEIGVGIVLVGLIVTRWSSYEDRFRVEKPAIFWITADVATNASISLSLVFALYTRRSVAVSKHMNTVISRLIIVTLESGCVPAFDSVITYITFILFPFTNLPVAIFFLLSHLYGLTMLYTLNVRESLRKKSPTADAYDMLGLKPISDSVIRPDTGGIQENVNNSKDGNTPPEVSTHLSQSS